MSSGRVLRENVQQALNELMTNPDMASIKEPPLRPLKCVMFGILSPEEIEAISVCKVTKSKISMPYTETVYDERMGPSHSKSNCLTCGENKKCPGHFGFTDLGVPIPHPQFIGYLVNILTCFCLKCSECKITQEELDLEGPGEGRALYYLHYADKLNASVKLCSNVPFCKKCEEPYPEITLFEGKIYKVYQGVNKKKVKSLIPIDELLTILKKIKDQDLKMIGIPMVYRECYKYNGKMQENISSFRPEWLIQTKLPILPTVSRPPDYEGGIKSDDDLTSSYTEIIKNNQKLIEGGKKLKEKTRQEIISTLETYLSSFIDNKDEKVKHTSGKPIKSIKERISSKQGHIRGKLMGKRVDCCARTVITADPNIDLDEVGVPEQIAKELSFPVKDTPRTFHELNWLLENNKVNMINRNDKLYINNVIKNSEKKIKLKLDDKVYRQLADGDALVFNRQPTLHRGSMMSHRAKILPGKTLRMNPAATKPYNAD